jgi:hypothetical protein
MEKVWVLGDLAVTVARIDFLDPAVAGRADARERGVRVEVRPASVVRRGSIYASHAVTLEPADYRIDLLESRPGAADRMHWHPTMTDGEPGERVFDPALSADPLAWVTDRLSGTAAVGAPGKRIVDEIVEEIARGLGWARQPWPSVEHDERGLAVGS